MDVLTVAAMLLAAGYADSYGLDESALEVVEACGVGPRVEPRGEACWAAAVAIWSTETRAGFQRFPRAVSGCGPMQVLQPRGCFRNTRIGRQCAPTCLELRVPRTGIAWGVRVLRWKRLRSSSMSRAFRYYNGNRTEKRCYGAVRPLMECYQRTATRTFAKAMEVTR